MTLYEQPDKSARLAAVQKRVRHQIQLLITDLLYDSGVTQRQLALRLGVSEARVSQYFAPKFNMTINTLVAVLHALGEQPIISAVPDESVALDTDE